MPALQGLMSRRVSDEAEGEVHGVLTSVIALAARIEDPVSLSVDNRLIARGELIETEEGGLGVKITEIAEDPDAKGT